jgi:hypothetical protein
MWRQCSPFGLSGKEPSILGLPPSRIRIFCAFPRPPVVERFTLGRIG